jgi:cytochrome c
MKKIKLFFAALMIGAVVLVSIEARPKYMRRYNADPKAKAEYKNKCTICHIGKGGGENTYFGEAFSDAGEEFTPELRAKYPKYFK